MPSDLPVAEGGRPGGGGGLWLVIGAIAGVGTLVFLIVSSKGSSSGTTAAGTSINAALGSIQEQQLNMMGQLGASTAALSTQMSDFQDSTLAQLTGMQDSLTAQNTALDSHLTDINSGLLSELTTINNGVIANGQSITGLGGQLTQYYSAVSNAQQQTQQQYNALVGQIAAQGVAASDQQKQQLSALQNYLGTLSQKSDYIVAMLSTWFPALSGLITAQGAHPDVKL